MNTTTKQELADLRTKINELKALEITYAIERKAQDEYREYLIIVRNELKKI